MKLFLREHALLIGLQCIQFVMIIGVFWLAGYRDIELTIYSLFLMGFFLICYLTYQYLTRKEYYHRLEHPIQTFDESNQSLGQAPIALALQEVLMSQYKIYAHDREQLRKEQADHHAFLDRWIHQMKTPVSVIELLSQDIDEPEASDVREETECLKEGLNTVLYMARLRSIQADFHIEKVELRTLIQEVNNEQKRLFIRNKIYPEIKAEGGNFIVETDEKWLYFILTQIIQNAVKYSKGYANQVTIHLYERSENIICEVIDYGVGIPESDKKRLFDLFFTGENGRKYRESTGVGLYLVKIVADYLGHTIEVESTEGKGTVFRIVF